MYLKLDMNNLLFWLFFITATASISQTNTVNSNNVIVDGFDGSYQIEIHNIRLQPNIPGNILEIVATNRSENETVYYPLDSNIRIKIPSRNEVLNPDFQKLDFIKYY